MYKRQCLPWLDRLPLTVRSDIDPDTDANIWRGRARFRCVSETAPDAARLLVQAIGNEQLSFSLRIDCAKDVLNRIYGKQAPPEQPGSVRFVLEEELERYAK